MKYCANLLIGKTYRVTSAQPIICTAKSCEDINVDQDDERSMTIVWPVSYEIVDNMRSASRQVRLIPPLVGMYTWNTNTCCETEKPDGPYVPSCATDCTCGGGCDTGGFTFSYEGYRLDFSGVECGCKPNEGNDDETEPASVSVSFSKQAIIYEETYETAPGITVSLRSTGSVLTCSASGGPKGGIVEFTLADGNRLAKSGGSFPYTKELAPSEEVSFEIACTGQTESSSEDDIVVTGIFTENETGEMLAAEDRLTIVRVEFLPKVLAPNNPCIRRHKYGVRESVGCYCQPNLQNIQWRNVGSGNFKGSEYVCSLDADERPIEVRYKNAEYIPLISVVTPNGIEAVSVDWKEYGVPTNHAGGIGMMFDLRVLPLDVCFSEIAIEEVPCDIGIREGYFSNPVFSYLQSHTYDNGAGRWSTIDDYNLLELRDEAAISSKIPRITPDGSLTNDENFGWSNGKITWNIPCGWGERDSVKGTLPHSIFAKDTKSEMEITVIGRSSVRKFNHKVERDINGDIFWDSRKVK